jgi:5-hydroxyisourate hydrolase-like protein (transthyretin family)
MLRNGIALVAWGLLLLPCLTLQAQQTEEHIGGRVVSEREGSPLAHATVTLWSLQSQRNVATATTDSGGHFRFETLPAGKYRLTAAAANYSTASYMQHDQYSTAIVTGAGLATDSLELRLTPVASISGRVFEGVDPVQHANVSLYREEAGSKQHVNRERSAQTDEEGVFEFSRLAPGSYFLSVSGTPWYAVHPPAAENAQVQYRTSIDPSLDVAYPMAFYPDALDSSGASPIEIHGGEEITANMLMHPVHAVTVTIQLRQGETTNQPFAQVTRTVFGVEEPTSAQMTQTGGTRQISGLAPGEYNIREVSMSGTPIHSRPLDLRGGSTSIEDEAAADTASVSVTVHRSDGAFLPPQLLVNLRASGNNNSIGHRLNDKGDADIPGVPAGEYRLVFTGNGQAMHLVTLSVDGKPIGNGQVSIAGSGHVAVDATVSPASSKIDGFVHRDGKAAAGLFVVLVPAGGDTGEELFRRDQSDLDGSFAFSNVSPGNYIVFAADDVAALHWTDSGTLMPYLLHGVPISVPPSGTTVLHLSEPVVAQKR